MLKRALIAVVAVFVAWTVIDIVIHGILLEPSYNATADLWRPMDEMNMWMMHAVTLIYTASFVTIYTLFVANKSPSTGFQFGLLYGFAAGVSMGFGSYSYMPIPLSLALSWFGGMLLQGAISGTLAGLIIKRS